MEAQFLGLQGQELEEAGGGYFGGGAGGPTSKGGNGNGGGGGSSYISGHDGCIAISQESTSDNIIMLDNSNHYSGYVFNNTVMISGINEQMTEPDGTVNTNYGHRGNGYVRITFLGS